MDGYITVADFGEWQILEKYNSDNTSQESERILEYCIARERKSRRKKAEREAVISNVFLGLALMVFPVLLIFCWFF